MIRQEATTLAGIRDDHRARYEFAIEYAKRMALHSVLDAGCGIGYGAKMMQDAGLSVLAFDRDEPTMRRAVKAFPGPTYYVADFTNAYAPNSFLSNDLVTAFEVIEHSPEALFFLRDVRAKYLIGSVPNEDVTPYKQGVSNPEHYRHFTAKQIANELLCCYWRPLGFWGQAAKRGPDATVTNDCFGKRTIVFVAERSR